MLLGALCVGYLCLGHNYDWEIAMINKWFHHCLFAIGLIVSLSSAVAQEVVTADPLAGYWKQKNDLSFTILVVNSEGLYDAEILRSDWSPGLIGTKFFRDVKNTKKNRWEGEADRIGSEKTARVTIKVNRAGELSTRLRPGGSTIWVRSEPVEKRE